MTPRVYLAVLLASLGVSACSQPTAAGRPAGAAPRPGHLAEIEAIYRARTDSARMRFTDADAQFMTGMIHHHAQAIEMARFAPTHAASSSVRTLAARIINAQQDEIALMQQWLRERALPVPELHIANMQVMVRGATHQHGAVPGMATPEQLRALGHARGLNFDRLFLKLMIQHHRGAVAMVHELFATNGAAQDDVVFKFASDVQVDQSTEVARMEQMLAALAAAVPSL